MSKKQIEYTRPVINFSINNFWNLTTYKINEIEIERILRKYAHYIKFPEIPKIKIPDFWIFKNEETIIYEESWSR